MRIIVTGGTSFIGSKLARKLALDGHEVFAVVRPGSVNIEKLHGAMVTFIHLDMKDITQLVDMKCLQEGIDVWMQFAWDGIGSTGRSNEKIQKDNIEMCKLSLKTAARLGCKKYFFSGSQAEYGICREATDELHACAPVSEYGKAKLDFGTWAENVSRSLGICYYHLRIFSVYGPGDHATTLVNTCVDHFSKGEPMEFGSCDQIWNYMYIDDCVEAIIALNASNAEAGIYNIASHDTRFLKEFINEINMIYGDKGKCIYGIRKPNAEGTASLIPVVDKLEKCIGKRKEHSFRDGIIQIRRP